MTREWESDLENRVGVLEDKLGELADSVNGLMKWLEERVHGLEERVADLECRERGRGLFVTRMAVCGPVDGFTRLRLECVEVDGSWGERSYLLTELQVRQLYGFLGDMLRPPQEGHCEPVSGPVKG